VDRTNEAVEISGRAPIGLATATARPPLAMAQLKPLPTDVDANVGDAAAGRPPLAWTRSAGPSKVTVTEPSRSVR
jgi:hypothetical protein